MPKNVRYYGLDEIFRKKRTNLYRGKKSNNTAEETMLIDPHGKIAAANPAIEDLKKWGLLTGTDRRMPQHSPCVPMQTEQD